jgi:serine/threonine-protein kinase
VALSFESLVGGRYEIGQRLGVGGMSEVYAATDQRLGRQVAVKFLRAEVDDPTARARIEGEARAAAALSHPNIVNVFDAGDYEGRPYVVMELADSRSLADVIRDEGPLPPDRVRSIGAQVLAALAAAHAEGIVHRDVKPANILVSEDGKVKLADFGIAKSFSDAAAGLTGVGLVMGTPSYLSPEQASGRPATPRSDLYATGVVLFEALTGTPPFTGDTPLAVVAAHSNAPVPDIRAAAPAVPASLAAVVERALAKEPADRFHDAGEMARALDGGPGAEPTAAVAVATTAPLRVPPAARPRRAWGPAVMGGLAVVLFVLLLWLGLSGGADQPPPAGPSTTAPTVTTTSAPPVTTTTAPPQRDDGDEDGDEGERGGKGRGKSRDDD